MPTTNETRAEHLRAFLDQTHKLRDDCPAVEALAAGDLARYAYSTFDGSSSWAELADNLDAVAANLANQTQEEYPWGPGEIVDLDTGLHYGCRVVVEIIAPTAEEVARV